MHTLKDIAKGCWDGACNPIGLLNSLGTAAKTIRREAGTIHPEDACDLRTILDHLSGLIPRTDPDIDLSSRYS